MTSRADIARALEVHQAMVTRWEKRGMPVYSIDAARAWRATNIRPRAKPRTPGQESAPTAAAGSNGNGTVYWAAKTRREVAEATKAEMEAKRMAGELVARDAVERAAYAVARLQRDVWLSFPAKHAAELAAMTSPQQVEAYLRERVAAVLADLARAAGTGLESQRP